MEEGEEEVIRVRREFEALLADPNALRATGRELLEALASQGASNPVPLILGCLLSRAASAGVSVDEEALQAAWPQEERHALRARLSGKDDTEVDGAFFEALTRCLSTVLAALRGRLGPATVEDVASLLDASTPPHWISEWIVEETLAMDPATTTAESVHSTADDKDASKEAAGADPDAAAMYSVIVEESSVTRPPPLEDRMHSPPIQEKQSPVMAEAALAQMEAMHEQETPAEKPLPGAIDRAVTLSKGAFTATLTVNDLAPLPTQEDLAELVPLLPEMALDPVPAAKLASEAPGEAEATEPAPNVETVQQAVVKDCEEQEEVLQNAAQQKGPFELTMLAASTMPASTGWGRPPSMRPRQAGVPLGLARRALRRVPKKFCQEEARLLLWSGNGHFLLECLRYLLAADFGTAPELFRTVVSRAVTAASAGLEDLDELLRRAYAALPLEALAALWAAAVEEVGLCSDGRAAAGYRLNYTQFSQAFFKSMPGGSSPGAAAFRSPQPGSATAQTLTASFKTLRRDFQHDRHRRPPSPWNSRSPRPLVTKGKPPKEPRPDPRSFSEALAFLVQGTDEGAVRLGLQLARSRACCKVLHTLFEVRDRDRHHLLFGKEDHDEDDEEELLHDRQDELAGKKMTRQDREEAQKLALRQKMRGSEMDFMNFSKDWHHVKSAPGPPCVIVEYPQGAGDLDWQQDVQVQEISEWRYIHKLVDGVPTTSYEECTDLIVVAVREDGPAQRRGVRDGYKLMSIGMRMGWWASPRMDTDDWLQSIRRIQTLAFEPCDLTAPTGPLPLLMAAAGGEKRGKEDQMAFTQALRRFGDGKERHGLERAMWEGVTAMVCSTNDGATREQAHLAVQMAGHPPPLADGAVDGLFDALLDTEIESLPPPEPISPRLLDTTQTLLKSSSQSRICKPHMRTRVAFCKVCGGCGHTADTPHLVHQEHLPPCNRRLPPFWGGTCGGHGHLPWQCPGLLQDPLGEQRCRQCLGVLPSGHTSRPKRAHPEVNNFLARDFACQVCGGLGHWWRNCPHSGLETVDMDQLGRLRARYLAESFRIATHSASIRLPLTKARL